MTADSQWPLQQAVFAALTGDATLQSLLGSPINVFDHVPQGTSFPYVVIGEDQTGPFDTKTEDGMDHKLNIHTWSQYQGFMEAKEIMAAITDALDHQTLSVTGHTLVLIRQEFSNTNLEEDGVTRHGVQRFRAFTQAAP